MRLLVLYGSQTGTAQDVAEKLWRTSKKYGFEGPVLPMDEFPIQQLVGERLVLFVVATTGDGDEPDNMRSSWRFLLRRSLPANSLEHLQFACLGLGDSSYAKFNYAAKKLNKRLLQLGAQQVVPLGLCDDQHDHGFGAAALPWMDQIWQELERRLGIRSDKMNNDANIFKWKCNILNNTVIDNGDDQHLRWPHNTSAEQLVLRENQRTTDPTHFQDVRLLKFAFPDSCTWNPGDVLQVQPQNSEQQVDDFFLWAKEHNMQFGPDTVVELQNLYNDMPLPKCYSRRLSVRQLATFVWDLSFKPRQRAFELLALHCDDELEKEKLTELASAEGLDSLMAYINRPRRTILEVLQDFRQASAKLTLNTLIELFTLIQPRSFSIASCRESGTLDLLVAVVEYKTKLSVPRLGLCSNWLKNLSIGSTIAACVKAGTMKFPSTPCVPLIMVGPGTGIAPFRSVIQSYHYLSRTHTAPSFPVVVFFGCRNKTKDYHFEADMEKWQRDGLVEMHCAFSRDQEEKVYVQNLIEKCGQHLRPLLLDNRALILVAGSSNNMPKSVKEAFSKILEDRKDVLDEMIKERRYQEETWS